MKPGQRNLRSEINWCFFGDFCTDPDVAGLFVEDGVIGLDGFPRYMREVFRLEWGFL